MIVILNSMHELFIFNKLTDKGTPDMSYFSSQCHASPSLIGTQLSLVELTAEDK
jgi:hypothetical protein